MTRFIIAFVLIAVATGSVSADPIAYVINTSGESLSKINLATGQVDNDILTLGSDVFSYPNQIIVWDTLAYVVASGTDEIQIIDLGSETTAGFISTGSGSNPYWMAIYDQQTAYVTLWVSGELVKVDLAGRSILDAWPIGDSPEGVMIHDHKVYVAVTAFNQSTYLFGQGKLVVFDALSDSVIAEIPVGKNPQYLARDSFGRIHVVCTGDYFSTFGIIYVIDPDQEAVIDSMPIGGSPGNISIGPDDMAYIAAGGWVGDGNVYTYDAAGLTPLHNSQNPLVVDSGCMMVVTYQDSSCFVGSFEDFVKPTDSSGAVLDAFAVGDGPVHVDFNYRPADINGDFIGPDIGDLVYLVNYMFNGGAPPPWPSWRADVNGDSSGPDIADLVYLVNYMFNGGPPPRRSPS
ncbi:MAG: hypothetical protein ABIE70_01375 [bacterium]